MANKPGVLCKLTKGKVIDAQDGFVDTFNWMVDFIDGLTCEGPLSLDIENGKPVIRIKGLEESKAVTDVVYDPATHQFTKTTKKFKAVAVKNTEATETVFSTMPHDSL